METRATMMPAELDTVVRSHSRDVHKFRFHAQSCDENIVA